MSENLPTQRGPDSPAPQEEFEYYPHESAFSSRDMDEGLGFSLKWILPAFKRYWWVMVLSVAAGVGAATIAFRMGTVEYRAQGSIWITTDTRQGDLPGPITQGELLESTAWEELLTSFQVLDPVVLQERLYLSSPPQDSLFFQDFSLADAFDPGTYQLTTSADAAGYTLFDEEGMVLEEGEAGDSIGVSLGFSWAPPVVAYSPEADLTFSVTTPREAARGLARRVIPRLDRDGNFLRLQLEGRDPVRVASVLTSLMDRLVEVAAELKRRKLDELTVLLREQLDTAEAKLVQAEADLEGYQIATITLPSEEASPIVPGLQQTTGTVLGEFFNLRMRQDALQSDRRRLEAALEQTLSGDVRVESYQMIQSVQGSSPLVGVLNELTSVKADLRTLRETYTDEWGPVVDLVRREENLKTVTIPSLTRILLEELQNQEDDLAALIGSRGEELMEIPPRAIEEGRRQRDYQIANDLYINVERRYETARLAAASSIPDVMVFDEPVPPRRPSSDDRLGFAGMVFLIPLGVGVLLIVLLDRLDPRLRDPAEIGGDIGLDWLATIPRYRRSARGRDNSEEIREAFRDLRMKVDFAIGAARPLVLSVTSPSEGEGKTFVSANLATAFADLGRKTILLDGDTRRGDLHHILERNRKPGLTDFLMNGANAQVVQETENPKLHFVGFGSRSSSSPELLNSSRMQALLAGLKRRYEVIILDSPPLAAGSDAFVIGAHAGNVLMVLRSGSTNKDLATVQMESFLRLPVRILGAVLNDFIPQIGQGYYKYYSRYLPGYEAAEELDEVVDEVVEEVGS